MGHQQVMPDQKLKLGGVIDIEPHPARYAPRHLGADLRMAAPVALADVVKEQGEVENLHVFDLAGELGEQGKGFSKGPFAQLFKLCNQPERMLIHGVNVVEVVEDHAEQPAELGDEGPEHAAAMHLHQRLVNPLLPFQNLQEGPAGRRRPAQLLIDQPDVIPDQLARFLADGRVVFLNFGEDADQVFGLRAQERGIGNP